MSAYLTNDILTGMRGPRDPSARLAVVSNDRRVPLRRRWKTGFSVDADHARYLRGLVELYDGDTLLGGCLISSSTLERDEHHFEFKRFTSFGEGPPVDFERIRFASAPDAPTDSHV